MFDSNSDSFEANSPEGRINLASTESQEKLFADAYSNGTGVREPRVSVGADCISPCSPCPRVDSIDPYKKEQIKEAALYRQELIREERRLFAEILLMAVMYRYFVGAGVTGPGLPYPRVDAIDPYIFFGGCASPRWGGHIRHWVRPRYWMHRAERIEHRLSRQWHNWSQHNHLQDWGKTATGFAGRLIADARHNVGQPVWAFTKFASVCQSGNLGCAATVSELLQEAGVKIPGSAGVYGLVDQLSAAGWQRIKISDKQQFRPGDVVFGVHGSHGHIGIISEANNGRVLVCDNSSSARTLKERTIESGGSFVPNGRFAGNLYVMRQISAG